MEKVLILAVLAGVMTSDTVNDYEPILFDDIVAVDSTSHQYISLEEGENWCWEHLLWEEVRINRPSSRRKETELAEISE
jgi:hypothetical protein